jgi:hypothetical protein
MPSELMPSELSQLEYPADCEVRRVQRRGVALLANKRRIPVGRALAGEQVAFRWVSEVKWAVLFGPITIGIFDLRRNLMIARLHSRQGRKLIYDSNW